MPSTSAKTPRLLAGWLLLCAFLNCAGWVLSAVHQLNAAGYSVCFVLGFAALFVCWRKGLLGGVHAHLWRRMRRRFSRLFPAAFLTLAVLVFLGGVLHPPTNYDGLAYREPRVLEWLATGQWHWIHTDFHRLNVRACGFEWLTAPLFLFTKTDRLVFLINVVSFLFLPGLTHSIFIRLGIRQRTAWYWMWLAPGGYCFLLQAGSIGNDLFGAPFALAAFDFALRAQASRRISQVWLSALAIGLLTGSKASNLPMLLPWAVAMLPLVPLAFRHFFPTLAVAVVVLACSFFPTAALNIKYCGDWSGQAAEQAFFVPGHRVLHLAQNAVLLALYNLVPPVFPWAKSWNDGIPQLIPPRLEQQLLAIFEPSAAQLKVADMQTEENAGFGFGLTVLVLATFVATAFSKSTRAAPPTLETSRFFRMALLGLIWFAALPFMSVSGSATPTRYLTPQVILMIPLFLCHQSGDWILRHRWWRCAGIIVFLMAAVLVIFSPARPLWPARTVLANIAPTNRLLGRARTVYSVYSDRADAFEPVCKLLPADATTLGIVTFDDPETSLWRPFFSRRIVHVRATEPGSEIRQRGIRYVLVNVPVLEARSGLTFEQWAEKNHVVTLQNMTLALRASHDPAPWKLVAVSAEAPVGGP